MLLTMWRKNRSSGGLLRRTLVRFAGDEVARRPARASGDWGGMSAGSPFVVQVSLTARLATVPDATVNCQLMNSWGKGYARGEGLLRARISAKIGRDDR
jgi:hypothetical protein